MAPPHSRCRCALWFISFLACTLALAVHMASSVAAGVVVAAPNGRSHPHQLRPRDAGALAALGVARELQVQVGPPAASLSAWILEPKGRSDPRGTILVVHGIRDRKQTFLGVGHRLAEDGYRVVLVDLRGHGESTGDFLTYGALEANDVAAVVEHLGGEKLLGGKLGVLGYSYGAAVALQAAAVEPRIDAVVSVASFGSLRDVVPGYAALVLPPWAMQRWFIDLTLWKAGRLASFDPDAASPVRAAPSIRGHVLLLQGRDDEKIDASEATRIQAAAPAHVDVAILDGVDHVAILADPTGEIASRALAWFGRYLRD